MNNFNLLETLLYQDKQYYLLNYHIQRLFYSAKYFSYKFNAKALYLYLNKINHKLQLEYENNTKICVRILLGKNGNFEYTHTPIYNLPLFKQKEKLILTLAKHNLEYYITDKNFILHKTDVRKHYENILQDIQYDNNSNIKFSDVILFNKQNNLTEATKGNIAILDKDNIWYTPPLKDVLLAGTLRQYLLYQGWLKCKSINIFDIKQAKKIIWFNSLRGIHEAEIIYSI